MSAPEWPARAALLPSNLTETGVRLAWPAANSPDAQLSYTLQWADQSQTTESTVITLQGLESWTDYTFTLTVIDSEGHQAAADLTLELKTPDLTPPVFESSEPLTLIESGEDFVVLGWTPAVDHVGIQSYYLVVNGADPIVLGPSQTHSQIGNLSPLQAYQVRLDAVDLAGNKTERAAELSLLHPDLAAPRWPDGAVISADELLATGVTLTWPAALDNVEVTAYQLQVNDQSPQIIGAGVTSTSIDNLAPWQTYQFSLRAQDAQGLLSSPLEIEVFTPDTDAPTWPNGAALIRAKFNPPLL